MSEPPSPPPLPPPVPTRGQLALMRLHRRRALTVGLLALVSIIGLAVLASANGDRRSNAPTASVQPTATTRIPQACADALALADQLAGRAQRLATAAIDHVVLMERLKLFLDGKPGGLDGHQAFRMGGQQMVVMGRDGPDVKVDAKRYREVRQACPLK